MKRFTKEQLHQLYIIEELNPYQIGKRLGADHKTIRAHLRKQSIQLRTASEYNFLAHKNYEKPTEELLMSPKSIAAHVAYLCEGWHTEKTSCVSFCNQDQQLIELVSWCLKNVYKAKTIRISVCGPTRAACATHFELYPDARFSTDTSRKNSIIRVNSGGKMLARDLVQNCYMILSSVS